MDSFNAIFLLLGCLLASVPAGAADDSFAKPITLIVPFPAGSGADLVAREIAPLAAERLQQTIVIENRPGANGNIGTEIGAHAKADGLTVLYVMNTTLGVNPHVYGTKSFNAVKDIRPFIVTHKSGAIVLVNAKSDIHSIQELFAAAKAKPGGLNYATSGPGSAQHMMGERVKKMASIDWMPIAYKGESAALIDLLGGQVDVAFGFPTASLPHVRSGKLRPLAVTTAKRSPALPDVPTLSETVLPGYEEVVWVGYGVPAATPEPVVQRLFKAFEAAANSATIRKNMEARGSILLVSPPAAAAEMEKTDYEHYANVVKELGLDTR